MVALEMTNDVLCERGKSSGCNTPKRVQHKAFQSVWYSIFLIKLRTRLDEWVESQLDSKGRREYLEL